MSGYDSDLYNDVLVGWYKETRQARVSVGRGTGLRTECVWINSVGQEACVQALLANITHHDLRI
ncbi:hypothetical protein VCRA2133O162_180097 [Vibrio crassostreae]|nr:hypothetical protein VCRA2118O144_190098 [Vibrio crassostreae]CAK2302116.1 hypothetical protein VCRA2117O143_190097 [Vibrio crassostreae]CAK2317968.1 hypothetical protein VCRA2117O142_220097 [Vibrio crassostreae]CAK2673811.1 hypothetical protein VCRA2120O151_180029 [Vibrio crassostreae]CAK2687218.1 hypothetical protein VCRA2121O153_190030 [Vibrio crassostreae]